MNCRQRNTMVGGGGGCVVEEEERRRLDAVICPKPRRLGLLNPDTIRPFRWPSNNQSETGDSKAGSELLDIILAKGGYGGEKSCNQVASSPPFFCGSPPTRASNPLIQDSLFGNEKLNPVVVVSPAPPSPSSRMGGGCVRMKFGQKPAAVRIEGFDCLSRDCHSNCSISAVA